MSKRLSPTREKRDGLIRFYYIQPLKKSASAGNVVIIEDTHFPDT